MPESTVVIDKTPHHRFRVRGELEQQHPDIEPLPPTPITPEARERLEAWGVPEEFIERLQEMTSSFRYDLCPMKTKRIAEQGGHIGQARDGSAFVVLPSFHDTGVRLDGTCGDIAVQLLKMMHSSGFIDGLNQILTDSGKKEVNPCFVEGTAPHFNGEGARHVWAGFLPTKESVDNMVIVDGSFQQMITTDAYHVKRNLVNPQEITDYEPSEVVPVGSHYVRPDESLAVSFPFSKTLGIAEDRKFVYGLVFARDGRSGQIDSLIHLIPPNPEEISPVCMLGADGNLKWDRHNPDVHEGHLKELKEMLTTMKSLQLINDQDKARELAAERVTIKLG